MPRPPKLTSDVQKRITDALAIGCTYKLAAQYGGVTYETLNQWRKTKPEFSQAIENAEARAVVGWLARIEQAANAGEWQAAAWKLERRYPQDYGRRQLEVTGRDGGPIQEERITRIVVEQAPPRRLLTSDDDDVVDAEVTEVTRVQIDDGQSDGRHG